MTTLLTLLLTSAIAAGPRNDSYFQITVVDEETGRGVPLIELRTVNNLAYYTDSAGVVAFHEPGWMDQTVFFYVSGHGYEFPKDVFGFAGCRLKTDLGGSAVVKVRRTNIAERLYRVTGGGIFIESQQIGQAVPFQTAPLNAQVIGSDSVQAAVFRDLIHWFWGDTNRPSYPLGNFEVPGATSQLPNRGGLGPQVGVELHYFAAPDGFAKSTCKMPGDGPTWIDGLAVVKDADNLERLFAHYLKVKPPLDVYRQGMAEFISDKQEFEPRFVFPDDAVIPSGHSFSYTDDGVDYICFAKPFSLVRVRATAEAFLNHEQYEALTCLKSGSYAANPIVERDENGNVRYGWKRKTSPMTAELQRKLIASGKLQPTEGLYRVRNVETGKPIAIHNGSVNWNEFRRRWVLIATESNGTSKLGEVWYAEANTPMGPWAYARKIVTHNKQSFYNPKHHRFFDQQNGRVLFFEGTYTNSFSANDERTPRYEYNQIMYRLDLDDARLRLPVAIYSVARRSASLLHDAERRAALIRGSQQSDSTFRDVAFFACDRSFPDSIPIFSREVNDQTILSAAPSNSSPLFHAFAADAKTPPKSCVPLFEHTSKVGQKRYLVGETKLPEFERASRPLCYVWPAQ